jgi:MFS family permease
MVLHIYTIIHTLISLIAILTGLIVLFGMIGGKRLDGWTKWFLITAVLTTVTGFFFPFHGVTPAIILGIITVPVLAITIYARYSRRLTRHWRWIYVIGAVLSLYFNPFSFWSCRRLKKCPPCMQWLRRKLNLRLSSPSSSSSSLPFCWESLP